MDAKQACDKLNGFNFQNRYLVGRSCGLLLSHMPIKRPLEVLGGWGQAHAADTLC